MDIIFNMDFLTHLQGGNSIEVWVSGIAWSFVGIALVKLFYYKRTSAFSFKFWINDNIKDVGLGFLLSLIVLRMGNFGVRMFERAFDWQIGEVEDFVAFMIFVSIFIQYKLHKNREPISKEVVEEMEECNRKYRSNRHNRREKNGEL